ncbi:MAG: ECF transporter S component, partial [Clostridia bacterium]|nr:ECF transporter S component [Clostridia bacterium]
MRNKWIRSLVLSAMFFALGLVLPFVTGQIPQVGQMLLPMHLPVFLCSLICGWQFGLPVGLLLPVVRSMLFGMPPLEVVHAMDIPCIVTVWWTALCSAKQYGKQMYGFLD